MGELFSEIQSWLKAPFTGQMSAVTLFFSIGLVMIMVIFWVFILEKLEQVET